jgi:signal transduction histidine kinase
MSRPWLKQHDQSKLRLILLLFLLALLIPSLVLIKQAYGQLKWEAFHQYQSMAKELSVRVNNGFNELIEKEEARAFTDYSFTQVQGDPSANYIQRSPLSAFPVEPSIPGLVGYFQIDVQGQFTTPLLPIDAEESRAYGISLAQLNQRLILQERIQHILSENKLVPRKLAESKDAYLQGNSLQEKSLQEQGLQEKSLQEQQVLRRRLQEQRLRSQLLQKQRQQSKRLIDADDAAIVSQKAFDRLTTERENTQIEPRSTLKKSKASNQLGRVEDLKLASNYRVSEEMAKQEKSLPNKQVSPKSRAARKEQSALPTATAYFSDELSKGKVQDSAQNSTQDSTQNMAQNSTETTIQSGTMDRVRQAESSKGLKIKLFESEIDPFEFSLLDSGHFILYRKVWRNGHRTIQGVILEQRALLQGLIETEFRETALSQMSELIVAYQDNVLSAFSGQIDRSYLTKSEELQGEMLYRAPLFVPFNDLELIFSIQHLPAGQGGKVIIWSGIILAIVLFLGIYFIYRLGVKQIALISQQQDFVSSVSHELKTPLTSIRMYGEILKQGWASEEKKREYYHFIFDESERLSRLITNVLQLARMNHNELVVALKPITAGELLDMTRSKISNQVDVAGYQLNLSVDQATSHAYIEVDADCFSQIMINLVDNAIKFSAKAENKVIDISAQLQPRGVVTFTVRDYGPGVPKKQMKKIFKLFYRSEAEMTRETVGTGIGLALVKNLVAAMDGEVDVVNQAPGAAFCISFTIQK